MKFVLTLDMPSSQGSLVHQVTIEHSANSVKELCDELNKLTFVAVNQLYKDDSLSENGEIIWIDKGDIGVNTDKIGKIQIHGDKQSYDNSHGNTKFSRNDFEGKGRPVRPGRRMF